MKVIVVVLAILAASLADQTSYEGYKVYQVTPKTEDEMKILSIFSQSEEFDFWTQIRAVGNPVSVMVSPEAQKTFANILKLNKIEYVVLIENVQSTIVEERSRQATSPKVANGRISFTQYHRYGAIQEYLEQLARDYPDIVTLENIATSTEGRALTMIKVGTGGTNKPAILIEGGIHAREWIAPALVLYIIQQLVENEDNRSLIANTDWLLIPVLNPDGYEYSHTSTRLWRKTRSRGTLCYGVDGNRNYDFHWMETGASNNECSETYAGRRAFSEPETTGLKTVVEKYGQNIKLYLAIHSYGQYILYPWGYTSALPADATELHALGQSVEAAIRSISGTRYTIGSSTNVLYAAAGGSDDWVKGVGGVQLSYTLELPGGGTWGFDLPASRIQAVVHETWQGIVVYEQYVRNKFASKV